ncbi:DUF3164 family protein [Belliella sp. DSM 107340]|uniref:DUF3164 family protein n=1 Tax=Belliella calami TaxID=2923436 RepID=A0ABS9UUC2_9BACT|nr:DUF3164 family protein [Belliella calami]MCH7400099.1 DUF3164 family protein [Belliella calami]
MQKEILNKQVSELTEEELSALLQERQKKARQEKAKKEKEYQLKKNQLVRELLHKAQGIQEILVEFKKQGYDQLKEHYELMKQMGEVASNNKGNFHLKSDDGQFKVEFSNHVNKEFDERAEIAAEHLNEFLESFMKKQNMASYKYIKGLSEKKNDKFDIGLVGRLFKMENEFDNPSWKKAIELFKASYTEVDTTQYIRFFIRNEQNGQYENVNLNFASV